MDIICPVCNGLKELLYACPNCNQNMAELGSIDNFLGPYSPYQDLELMELNNGILIEGPDPCVHLMNCPNCHTEERVLIEKISI